MTKEHDLAKLENIIENLLERFNALKKENSELSAQLNAQEDKIVELNSHIDELNEDKTGIHGRVSNLLSSIEDWEKSLEDENSQNSTEDISAENISDNEEKSESQLFNIGE